ncbi:MAG: DUF2848 family protein [Candidatus Hodarchaeota archaeon]
MGFAGRNRAVVMKHIEEAKKLGIIWEGSSVPVVLAASPERLTTDNTVQVKHEKTSGEVEYVILVNGPITYVTVGSDHTDREIEKLDLQKSKDAVPKIISSSVWLYEEVKDHWDDITIRSWIQRGGIKELYQDDKLRLLLTWEDLEPVIKDHVGEDLSGTAVFAGTIPTIKQDMLFADIWELEMFDPVLKRSLRHKYVTRIIPSDLFSV